MNKGGKMREEARGQVIRGKDGKRERSAGKKEGMLKKRSKQSRSRGSRKKKRKGEKETSIRMMTQETGGDDERKASRKGDMGTRQERKSKGKRRGNKETRE